MTCKKFAHTLPALCAALLLAACGGEGGSMPQASSAATPAPVAAAAASAGAAQPIALSAVSASMELNAPEQGLQAMAGYINLGKTCYANSALKFIIHAIGPLKLKQHLAMVEMKGGDALQSAAAGFIQLIDSTHSASGPTSQELRGFFDNLLSLPAFKDFSIIGTQQDASDFLLKLSQSFALHEIEGSSLVLNDDNNQFRTDAEANTWLLLKPTSTDDSLQDLFDRTSPGDWKFDFRSGLQHLTVKIDNFGHGTEVLYRNANFDFNEPVQLQVANGNLIDTLTLEPREVIEFRGTANQGHYIAYAKDDKWVRYNDHRVEVLGRMPSIENVRLIHFAIRRIETQPAHSLSDPS